MQIADQRTQEPEPIRRDLNPSRQPGRGPETSRRPVRPEPAPRADYERFCVDWFLPDPAERMSSATAER